MTILQVLTMKRQDETGLNVKVTSFAGRLWGIRILCHGQMLVQTSVTSKDQIGAAIAHELRWLCKMGHPSPMADAARDRLSIKIRSPEER